MELGLERRGVATCFDLRADFSCFSLIIGASIEGREACVEYRQRSSRSSHGEPIKLVEDPCEYPLQALEFKFIYMSQIVALACLPR